MVTASRNQNVHATTVEVVTRKVPRCRKNVTHASVLVANGNVPIGYAMVIIFYVVQYSEYNNLYSNDIQSPIKIICTIKMQCFFVTGICSAWGDSHYTTFDGKSYEFQGVCDYVLTKGSLSPEEVFEISTQNVPCGSTGVTCSKSITLVVGAGDNQETITLTKGKELPKETFQRIAIRKAGLFVFLDVPDLGLVLQWDEGKRGCVIFTLSKVT